MYLTMKVLHIVAVTLFLGNIITGVMWKYHAEGTRDPRIIAHTFEGITRSDRWFTLPGVALIILTGITAAIYAQLPLLRTGWILWSLGLFILSGIVFMIWVGPLQHRIAALARAAGSESQMDWAKYHSMERKWGFWGAVAVIAPLAAVVLMVFKPALPAL